MLCARPPSESPRPTIRLRRLAALGLAAALCVAMPARADRLDDALQIAWEALWDQRGLPRQVLRWEPGQVITWTLSGPAAAAQRDVVELALRDLGGATGLRWREAVAGDASALDIEVGGPEVLSDREPCATQIQRTDRGTLLQVKVRIRATAAWRCTWHELMHAVGIPGHPSGRTVLSYFQRSRSELTGLDRVMLAAWYSQDMPRHATPLEAIVVLSEAVARQNEAALSEAERRERVQAFRLRVLRELESFARGEGGRPEIVARSGKLTDPDAPLARRAAAAYLALAYGRGTIVARDPTTARLWLERANAWARAARPASDTLPAENPP